MPAEESPRIELPLLTATAVLRIGDEEVRVQVSTPRHEIPVSALLPQFRAITDALVDHAVQSAAAAGDRVSCTSGCGACCRQLVPISETEARHLRNHVNDMPEPRRSLIRNRFAEARAKLDQAGLLDALRDLARVIAELPDDRSRATHQFTDFGLRYFFQGIPCPFLEEESCSIYEERPIACREYLVTSPAEDCARPNAETIRCVDIGLKVSKAINQLGLDESAKMVRLVPLILALEWAEQHPTDPVRPGPAIVQEWFEILTEQKLRSP